MATMNNDMRFLFDPTSTALESSLRIELRPDPDAPEAATWKLREKYTSCNSQKRKVTMKTQMWIQRDDVMGPVTGGDAEWTLVFHIAGMRDLSVDGRQAYIEGFLIEDACSAATAAREIGCSGTVLDGSVLQEGSYIELFYDESIKMGYLLGYMAIDSDGQCDYRYNLNVPRHAEAAFCHPVHRGRTRPISLADLSKLLSPVPVVATDESEDPATKALREGAEEPQKQPMPHSAEQPQGQSTPQPTEKPQPHKPEQPQEQPAPQPTEQEELRNSQGQSQSADLDDMEFEEQA